MWGGIERANGSAGCGGMSADVWDFAEAGAGVDCGGRRAITRAVEGAEDSGAKRGAGFAGEEVARNDVVVGIAASGTTPYVLGR